MFSISHYLVLTYFVLAQDITEVAAGLQPVAPRPHASLLKYRVCQKFLTNFDVMRLYQPLLYSLTHSLLHLTSEGRSDLRNERSCADDHSESIVHPWSSSTCCIQVFLGRPGGRFQSGAGICPATGWHSAGGYCGLARLVVGGKHVLAVSVFCRLWWGVDPSALAPNGIIGDEVIPLYVPDAPLFLHVKSLQSGRVGFGQSPRLRSMQQDWLNKGRVDCRVSVSYSDWVSCFFILCPTANSCHSIVLWEISKQICIRKMT